jgi:hypothetical protein
MKLRRISIKKAKEKALPILLSGFKKRHQMRSTVEESRRAAEKVARDRQSSRKPHLSAI